MKFVNRIIPLWLIELYLKKVKRPPCVNCNEVGILKLEDGKYICTNCAQIQSELADMWL